MATEYISREAAINAAMEGADIWDGGCSPTRDWWIEKHIDEVPAADVRPVKIGHYITDDMGDSSCSECGEKYLDITKHFCPECGAELLRNDGDQ